MTDRFSLNPECNQMIKQIMIMFCLMTFALSVTSGFGQEDSTHVEPREPPILTRFCLDWQTCTIHRYNTAGPFTMLLSGSIHSTYPHCWTLWPFDTHNSLSSFTLQHKLHKKATLPGEAIPIRWEFSLDGQPFTDLNVGSDGRIRIDFPPD